MVGMQWYQNKEWFYEMIFIHFQITIYKFYVYNETYRF